MNGKKDRLHRQLMAENLGRPLENYEHVYHKNGNSMDNRIENLVLVTKVNSKSYTRENEKTYYNSNLVQQLSTSLCNDACNIGCTT